MFCRQQVAELAKFRSNFIHKNAEPVVVGTGAPHHFEDFRKVTGYDGQLLSDPSRRAFTLLGFTSRVTGMIGIKPISKALSALKEGSKPGPIQGSVLQLGGAIIIDPSDTVRYFFASPKAGDHPAMDELLAAVDDVI